MIKFKKCIYLILCMIMVLTLISCSEKISYNLIFADDVVVKEGTELSDETDPFGNRGIYADPEVDIDGVREAEYDYPTGSGRYLVHASETETTYVSIYKGDKGIYFLFECDDDSISTLNVEDINLVTAQSDSVELYMDVYGVGGAKRGNLQYEFRVAANGRIYAYLTGFVARVFMNEGSTINEHKNTDNGFTVEGYVSYSVMGDDVNKNTSTSFQFARVTKTGNRGHSWHGAKDPQIPDNYMVLHSDNKFYPINECPVSGVINGRLVDLDKNPVSGARVDVKGHKTTYTNANGEYSINLTNYKEDIKIDFTKNSYLSNSVVISKNDIRLASNNVLNLSNSLLIAADAATYSTTIKGKLTERDGVTPINNAVVEVNGDTARTNEKGEYTLVANCQGYENVVTYYSDTHLKYTSNLDILNVNINGITELQTINLDENYGDQIEFGDKVSGKAYARVIREETSFKLVLKTASNIDISQFLGSNFEVFIDTKESSSMNKRDASDYMFCFQYSDNAIVDITNYGGLTVNQNGITTTYGRINDLYYVEVDIPYEKINVTKDEVFGFYFGIKYLWLWSGMYDTNGNYIPAEATINYVRFSADSKFFTGSTNFEPATNLEFKELGKIGSFQSNAKTVQYDVSYSKEIDAVWVKFDLVDNGVLMLDQTHSINLYLDMNSSLNKNSRDNMSYHISIYPGKPVSKYNGWDTVNNKESNKYVYEDSAAETWAYIYGNSIYIKISNSVFGGSNTDNIGFAVGLWNDEIGSNSILSSNGHTPDFGKPSTYFIIYNNGNMVR